MESTKWNFLVKGKGGVWWCCELVNFSPKKRQTYMSDPDWKIPLFFVVTFLITKHS